MSCAARPRPVPHDLAAHAGLADGRRHRHDGERAARAQSETLAGATDCEFAASGTTITFPGYRQAYVESTDEGLATDAEREALLPALVVGQSVPVESLTPRRTTVPPARYTEASLVKRPRGAGIGRPSTWATSSRPSSSAATRGRRARRSYRRGRRSRSSACSKSTSTSSSTTRSRPASRTTSTPSPSATRRRSSG